MSKEQIERLKDNLRRYRYLSGEDQGLLQSLALENVVLLNNAGKWVNCTNGGSPEQIYRIHKDYKPQPKFPGMVLCEIELGEESGCKFFTHYKAGLTPLCEAVDYHCTGYNYLEAPDVLWDSPVAFVDKNGMLDSGVMPMQLEDGWKPATLVACAFPDGGVK